MPATLELGGLAVEVIRKDIKNLHLNVHPPSGRVRISAPRRMSADTIRMFAISKLGWIRQQQGKLRAQERETPREYLDRESHHVWGRRYLLRVVEEEAAPSVRIQGGRLVLRVRPGADAEGREAVLSAWYRQLVRVAAAPLLEAWAAKLGVEMSGFVVRQMKTRWGTCNAEARTIRLNTELAKKPRACLEYIVVHELIHLRDPTHGPTFRAMMDGATPGWRGTREMLNRLPARHERWTY